MNLLWMILLMLLVCVEAENKTLYFVKLGEDLTLNCTLDTFKIYWYMEIHSQFRGIIGWFYRSDKQYFVYSSEDKYELEEKSLTIRNITADNCKLYFCARRLNDSLHFGDTFRLVLDVPTTPSNTSSEANHPKSVEKPWLNDLLVFGSFALNAFLLSAVIGLVFTCLCLKKKKKKKNCTQQDTPQYEEMWPLPCTTSTPAAETSVCIYRKAQLPQSSLHQH